MKRFIEHNKHWQSPTVFAEQDPHLYTLKQQSLVHQPDLLYELPCVEPGIYTLSGGRQIGKTTLLKQWMHHLLVNEGFKADNIFFMTGEIISDHYSLMQLIDQYLNEKSSEYRVSSAIRILIIDEVNYIKNWDQGIKFLADSGQFKNVIVMLTGSDATFITEARMRFPGRRGKADKADFHLYPISFYEFIHLKDKRAIDPTAQFLFEEFDHYLNHGGFLTAINDYVNGQKVRLSTYNTYSDWVRGDFLKRGKSEVYLREILRAIIKTYGTQITWNALSDHTSINHHDTIRQYVELLESMDVLFIQNALLEDKLFAAPKKAKKIIFKDPFMYHALRLWVFPDQQEEDPVSSLVESCVISQYQRFYPCFYIKSEGEVDLAYVRSNKFFPVEVKWRNQIRTKDLKQISKYKNGLILNQALQEGQLNTIPTQPVPTHLYSSYIRERANQITHENLRGISNEGQIKIIEELLGRKSLPWNKPGQNNGFSYALGLSDSKIYQDVARDDAYSKSTLRFASPQFVEQLLKKKILEERKDPCVNDLILYFDEESKPMHAGIIKSCEHPELLIESKWGTFQKLFHHRVWQVPSSYGNKVRYYAAPGVETLENYFIEYCKSLS